METKSALRPDLVQEFVGKAHGDLNRIKEILVRVPTIVNASWDWGGGDWETALGAASHVGRRDIAEYLIAHGARIDLFAAAMLGKLEIVEALIADNPDVRYTKGPHGITLRAHATAGGDAALPIVAFLDSLDPVV